MHPSRPRVPSTSFSRGTSSRFPVFNIADYVPQKWTGSFFEPTTLTSLGHVVQLGHKLSTSCSNPSKPIDQTVFDLNGVHRIVVRFCHCSSSSASHQIQLLQARWFPATVFRPSTSFSFNLLDFFHKLQDQNKCNSYDFYHTIMQRSNNAKLEPEIVSLCSLLSREAQLILRSSDTTKSVLSFVSGAT